jgi:CHAT domain-containing protein/tetratricopeptide (TPR) repeat protein
MIHSGEQHSAGPVLEEAPSASNQMGPNRTDRTAYWSNRWIDVLAYADGIRRAGNLDLAERMYLDMLRRLREARHGDDDAVVLMLHHLGEFFLDARKPDRAYEFLSQSLRARRNLLAVLSHPPAGLQGVNEAIIAGRLHLADLLTRLGQLDLAKSNVSRAVAELTEANAIGNESDVFRRFIGGLYAAYFLSLALEGQGRWSEAEALWQQAVKGRETIASSVAYWNALKEQAAFYARYRHFPRAAEVARKLLTRQGSLLQDELTTPVAPDSWPRIVSPTHPQYEQYQQESHIAMNEIFAIDKWLTAGPAAAAAQLADPLQAFASWLDRGADAERAQMLRWLERRVFLHMSILLDGQPPQERVTAAYSLLAAIKGRFVGVDENLVRAEWRTELPSAHFPSAEEMFEQLRAARIRRAHEFVSSAIHGAPFDDTKFTAEEATERLIVEALLAAPIYTPHASFDMAGFLASIPPDTAVVDTVVWDRNDHDASLSSHREYGAFVFRHGNPAQYVRIGSATDIDAAVAELQTGVVGGAARGFVVQTASPTSVDVSRTLRRLYQSVLGPIEPLLGDASKVIVIADGKLALVPVGALVDGSGHSLLQRYAVSYVSSWRDLYPPPPSDLGTPAASSTTGAVVIGNPDFGVALLGSAPVVGSSASRFVALPGSEKEARDVAQLLHIAPDRLLLGGRAREALIQALATPAILHVATHSTPQLGWNPPAMTAGPFEFPRPLAIQQPLLQSVIALSGAGRSQMGPEDGLLTGLEVASLRLGGTKLVVLSSCESAQGTTVDGQGVLGLRSAFSVAGADAVVMSLWPVSDEASQKFMHLFYQALLANGGVGPVEALRQAQLRMQADPLFGAPLYWAGYVVSTRNRPAGTQDWVTAPAPPNGQFLSSPACFEMSTVPERSAFETVRMHWAGVVERRQLSSERVEYDLLPPGGDVEFGGGNVMPGGLRTLDPETTRARTFSCRDGSKNCRTLTMAVERTKDYSALTVRAGTPVLLSILVKGPSNLFPSFDLPEHLPPLSAYTETKVVLGELSDHGSPLEKLGACTQ